MSTYESVEFQGTQGLEGVTFRPADETRRARRLPRRHKVAFWSAAFALLHTLLLRTMQPLPPLWLWDLFKPPKVRFYTTPKQAAPVTFYIMDR